MSSRIAAMIEPSPLGTVWCQSVMERFDRSRTIGPKAAAGSVSQQARACEEVFAKSDN